MTIATIGIDVSKQHLDVAVYGLSEQSPYKQFPYTQQGQRHLLGWLAEHDLQGAKVCLEATGRYSFEIATVLYEAGYHISIENPIRTRNFAKSIMTRQKTDKVDAYVLAQYASVMSLHPWSPPTSLQSSTKDLKRLIDDLQTDRTRIINRLEGLRAISPARRYLKEQLEHVEGQIAEVQKELDDQVDQNDTLRAQSQLLSSIIGIGQKTASELLAEIPDWSCFASADELVAYAGLHPEHRQSGNKVGYSRLSKQGSSHIRKTLFFPALTAMRYNPHLKRFAKRLAEAGKAKMVVVVAVMRKLLVLAYAILKSGQPYDPNYQVSA